jgi:serine/threonine-protein kinase
MSTTDLPGPSLLAGRYRLVERLGAGGMSVVWRGFDEVLGRQVAVKVLPRAMSADPSFRRRLRAEAQAAARLSHPHITNVYDYGEATPAAGGTPMPFVVMELIDGESLATILGRARVLPWPAAVRICADVAAALAAAHARGIVHRDVTPANVMLTSAGAKVVDFGISALIGENDIDPDGSLLGTPAYLAPERLVGGQVSPAADVYAVGLLIYRSLIGQLPWDVGTTTALLRAHQYTEPDPLPPVEGLPPAVSALVGRCLEKLPDDRPSSAELAHVLAGIAAEAPKPPAPPPWADEDRDTTILPWQHGTADIPPPPAVAAVGVAAAAHGPAGAVYGSRPPVAEPEAVPEAVAQVSGADPFDRGSSAADASVDAVPQVSRAPVSAAGSAPSVPAARVPGSSGPIPPGSAEPVPSAPAAPLSAAPAAAIPQQPSGVPAENSAFLGDRLGFLTGAGSRPARQGADSGAPSAAVDGAVAAAAGAGPSPVRPAVFDGARSRAGSAPAPVPAQRAGGVPDEAAAGAPAADTGRRRPVGHDEQARPGNPGRARNAGPAGPGRTGHPGRGFAAAGSARGGRTADHPDASRAARVTRRRRLLVAAGALVAVAAAGFGWTVWDGAAPQGGAVANAAPPQSCLVTYAVLADNGRTFKAGVLVTNNSPRPVDDWDLRFVLPGDQKVTGAGTVKLKQQGRDVTAASTSAIPPRRTFQLNLKGGYRESNAVPVAFALNDQLCDALVSPKPGAPARLVPNVPDRGVDPRGFPVVVPTGAPVLSTGPGGVVVTVTADPTNSGVVDPTVEPTQVPPTSTSPVPPPLPPPPVESSSPVTVEPPPPLPDDEETTTDGEGLLEQVTDLL